LKDQCVIKQSELKPLVPALFLDRDGVINVDFGYVHHVSQIEFVPGIFDLVGFAVRQLCWPVVVVTNQAGIARGKFDEHAYETLTRWLNQQFEIRGAPINRFYHCPYHPEHGVGEYRRDHFWRKPNPGMILQAARDFSIDLVNSILIGDQASDIEAGAAAGVGLLIGLDHGLARAELMGAHEIIGSLPEALALIKARARAFTQPRT
jgi:D-glycero-D-manno-heptose 1,7-bisphosphate phosphatase